jgi:preprotein translocase subunit Sss1
MTASASYRSAANQIRRVISNKSEFIKIATSCAVGFAIMGTVGFVIKLVFIPINKILLS